MELGARASSTFIWYDALDFLHKWKRQTAVGIVFCDFVCVCVSCDSSSMSFVDNYFFISFFHFIVFVLSFDSFYLSFYFPPLRKTMSLLRFSITSTFTTISSVFFFFNSLLLIKMKMPGAASGCKQKCEIGFFSFLRRRRCRRRRHRLFAIIPFPFCFFFLVLCWF